MNKNNIKINKIKMIIMKKIIVNHQKWLTFQKKSSLIIKYYKIINKM